MKDFTNLIYDISQTKSVKEKTEFITRYFQSQSPENAVWGLFFLCGYKIKRLIGPQKLFQWCIELSHLPEWIALESYAAVGDLAEAIALLMTVDQDSKKEDNRSLHAWMNDNILPLQSFENEKQKEQIVKFWKELDVRGIFVLNKILTGALRIGVSQTLTIQGLSKALQIPKEALEQKLMGHWSPSKEFFENLSLSDGNQLHLNPYPFYLASPLEKSLEELGDPQEWMAEWKWDGIRAQCIHRNGQAAIWSRGNELISSQFPEILEAIKTLESGTVLDGEILAFKEGKPLPFGQLQKRLGIKKVTKTLIESVPVIYMIYDILERKGHDVRKKTLYLRRSLFEMGLKDDRLKISPLIAFQSWDEIKAKRKEAESNGTEGLLLKKLNSSYGSGRKKGNWWKYKIDPKTMDVVLIYAQPGHGWRANLYTDYTFGIWDEGQLVPIAKAYSGLSNEEILRLDKWIRKNTVEKFGPVRKVKPEQVFEIAFDGIQVSKRHRSGLAVRFPRIARWRTDKPPEECDTLENIKDLLNGQI